jgi:hypothetical protein
VFSIQSKNTGVADAVAHDAGGKNEVIVDWKSDVTMSENKLAAYRTQLADYRKQTGAERALLVLMTSGAVLNV